MERDKDSIRHRWEAGDGEEERKKAREGIRETEGGSESQRVTSETERERDRVAER